MLTPPTLSAFSKGIEAVLTLPNILTMSVGTFYVVPDLRPTSEMYLPFLSPDRIDMIKWRRYRMYDLTRPAFPNKLSSHAQTMRESRTIITVLQHALVSILRST
ncbi:unnamed protein product [Protopolystoma xenopodis]|uniref:Uncharacterized protein n=1 Tax=Protopolystoma xenopodis TaxID=117903 RepID=A0A3S5CHT6_9PLAT|nr:unnamed protein product [Protopolystoma xenopodis]